MLCFAKVGKHTDVTVELGCDEWQILLSNDKNLNLGHGPEEMHSHT